MKVSRMIIYGMMIGAESYLAMMTIGWLLPECPTEYIAVAGLVIIAGTASIIACSGALVNILQGIADEYKMMEEDDEA